MNIDLDALRPVLVEYNDSAETVRSRQPADGYWLRIGSEQYQETLKNVKLEEINPSEVDEVLEPLQSITVGETTLVNYHPTTTPGRWKGLLAATRNDRDKAAEIFSDLFDSSLSMDERMSPFGDYFQTRITEIGQEKSNVPQSLSPSPLQGLSTALLELLYPESYVAYQYRIATRFFDHYSSYQVKTAGNTAIGEQYGKLVDELRSVRDELQLYDPDADMLDVHSILWNLEALEERAPETVPEPEGEGTDETIVKPKKAPEMKESLQANKQIILYGPPGTGKTHTATKFTNWWIAQSDASESSETQTMTFHPSTSYEDFVEGFAPADTSTAGAEFELTDGIFKQMATEAREDHRQTAATETTPRHVLIIDELNRGEVASIFGELVTALEADKRLDETDEATVSLSHSGEPFSIPPNLYVIGTMNTADRSISLIDTAIRRRFRFLYFPPRFDLIREAYQDEDDEFANAVRASADVLENINERLRNDLSRGKQIGHAYLFGLEDLNDLHQVWRYELLPLLEEYYFDQFDRLRKQVFVGQGDELFDWETQRIRSFDTEALQEALLSLR